MWNLQKLYDEIAPKYNNISNKRDEVAARISKLSKDMEKAEADYDVMGMEKLTTQLSSARRVHERIESDLKELQAELNGPHETTLSGKIRKAAEKDFQEENGKEEVQSKIKKINELMQQARDMQQELNHDVATKHLERIEETQKFRPFLKGIGKNATLASLGNYHQVDPKEVTKETMDAEAKKVTKVTKETEAVDLKTIDAKASKILKEAVKDSNKNETRKAKNKGRI